MRQLVSIFFFYLLLTCSAQDNSITLHYWHCESGDSSAAICTGPRKAIFQYEASWVGTGPRMIIAYAGGALPPVGRMIYEQGMDTLSLVFDPLTPVPQHHFWNVYLELWNGGTMLCSTENQSFYAYTEDAPETLHIDNLSVEDMGGYSNINCTVLASDWNTSPSPGWFCYGHSTTVEILLRNCADGSEVDRVSFVQEPFDDDEYQAILSYANTGVDLRVEARIISKDSLVSEVSLPPTVIASTLSECFSVGDISTNTREDRLVRIMATPNPVQNTLTITGLERGSITITDMHGQILERFVVSSTYTELDVSDWPAGAYLLSHMSLEGKLSTLRVLRE